MNLLVRNCIIHKFNPIVLLRGIIFGIFKRPLLRVPAFCQHKPDFMETLLFKNIILLFALTIAPLLKLPVLLK